LSLFCLLSSFFCLCIVFFNTMTKRKKTPQWLKEKDRRKKTI
jgi:hypothetical protein